MRVVSLSLRNYRVFEELDIELPSGLVGIYGPNGSGKSTLLESIMWALYGRARTDKHGIRTSGAAGECVAELVFEHDGHPYTVRRSLHGLNATVKARVSAGDQIVADGVTDAERYLRALIGMDATAFRSSVFSEQKQLDAFVGRTPEERRRLVLQLLGITPLDKARDAARADATARAGEHQRLVAMLPDLTRAEERSAAARSALDAAQATLVAAQRAATSATEAAVEAQSAWEAQEAARRRHDELLAEGRGVRAELERSRQAVDRLDAELAALAERDARRAVLEPQAGHLDGLRAAVDAWGHLVQALQVLARAPDPVDGPHAVDVMAAAKVADGAEAAARSAEDAWSDAQAVRRSLADRLAAAQATLEGMAAVEGADRCPTCGQEIGPDVATVRVHRIEEVDGLAAALAHADAGLRSAVDVRDAARQRAAAARAAVRAQEDSFRVAESRRSTREAARVEVDDAWARLAPLAGLDATDPWPELDTAMARRAEATRARSAAESAASELAAHTGALARREAATEERRVEAAAQAAAAARRRELLEAVHSLGFDAGRLEAAAQARRMTSDDAAASARAVLNATAAQASAERDLANADDALAQARAQAATLADLAAQAQLLARTAEVLGAFRHAMVATIGPRLATQASELFVELTGGEYDALVVDPERYDLRIVDRGEEHPISRFSGSEVDLANLALRVAISEQVRFQAGGHVGLLVLDEALASLDSDRKDRMLLALTRLSGRFRQVLVVTHAPEVKEQLPAAIEIVRRPGRRATARVLDATG